MKGKYGILGKRGFILGFVSIIVLLLRLNMESLSDTAGVVTSDFDVPQIVIEKVGDTTIYRIHGTNVENSKPRLVYLSILNDKTSYGNGRTFDDYLQMIIKQTSAEILPSIGILVSDRTESKTILSKLTKNVESLPFKFITLIHEPQDTEADRHARKQDHLQKQRRKRLAALRNMLSFFAISSADHVIWIDTDIVSIPEGLSDRMIRSRKDIVVPSCYQLGEDYDYDLNSWVGKRTHPSPQEIESIRNGGLYVPRPDGAQFIFQLKEQNKEFVELDSVGGTMLYLKADLFRKGVIFPPFYLIGTDWDRIEGWDGIETEGVCYIANTLGYKCWAMPFEVIRHVNN